MALNNLEWILRTLLCKNVFFGAYHENLKDGGGKMKKCSEWTLVSGSRDFANIHGGLLERRRQTTVGDRKR